MGLCRVIKIRGHIGLYREDEGFWDIGIHFFWGSRGFRGSALKS